jgi:hypothetical protein
MPARRAGADRRTWHYPAGLSLEPHPGFMADGVKAKRRVRSCMLSETNVVTVLGRRDPFAAAAARRSDSDGREFGDPCRWRQLARAQPLECFRDPRERHVPECS